MYKTPIPASNSYCHVFQWLSRWFGLANRFIGSWLLVTAVSSYTLKITVTITHVTSHTKSLNSSSGHTAVPIELQNSNEVNSHSRILSYPLGTDHAQKTQFYCCVAQTILKTSHVPVHWFADCCLATSYKHSSYCWVTLSEKVLIAPLPSYVRYNITSGRLFVLQPFVISLCIFECGRKLWNYVILSYHRHESYRINMCTMSQTSE
jgi:hypothetical protein